MVSGSTVGGCDSQNIKYNKGFENCSCLVHTKGATGNFGKTVNAFSHYNNHSCDNNILFYKIIVPTTMIMTVNTVKFRFI